MRKQNSEFITAFTSEANESLKNTDSFAYVELDDLACYVVADGIDDFIDAKSARLAVDSVISAFTEAPSMSVNAMRRYLAIANKILIAARSKRRLKASVIVVVHDYVKMRYGQAGNTRLRLYRGGFLKEQSVDHSLTMDMAAENRLEKDKLMRHQERNNLYCYLGQEKEFRPFISKKIKFSNTDAVAVYTRGIWENIDEGELTDVFADATTEPEETVGTVEDLLFSKQPKTLEKYTLVVLFINKVFEDPNRKRRIKRIVMTAVPIAMAAAVFIVILVIRHNKRKDEIASMNRGFLNAIEYMQADNYVRAQSDCQKALELAEKLKDKDMQKEAGNYLKLIESIIAGDDRLASSQYSDAQKQYLNALEQSRYTDKAGHDYIREKLELTGNYMSVYDLISLGDTLALNQQYENAEQKYLEAKSLAGKIYFDKGREDAIGALEKLYGDKKEIQESNAKDTQQAAEQQAGAAGVMAEGDKAFAQGDYEGALVFYSSAMQKYKELEDTVQAEAARVKMEGTQKKIDGKAMKIADAELYMQQAESNYNSKNYVQAKKYYLLAKSVYTQLKDDDKVDSISLKIEMIDLEADAAAEARAAASLETAAEVQEERETQEDSGGQQTSSEPDADQN